MRIAQHRSRVLALGFGLLWHATIVVIFAVWPPCAGESRNRLIRPRSNMLRSRTMDMRLKLHSVHGGCQQEKNASDTKGH